VTSVPTPSTPAETVPTPSTPSAGAPTMIAQVYSTVSTPAGPFTILVDGDGAVVASGFAESLESMLARIQGGTQPVADLRQRPELGIATTAVSAYFAGDLEAIDAVPVRQHSRAPFLTAVWGALRTVCPGTPISYTTLAGLAGRPAAVRAAAQGCARNNVALFVPCHRVLRADGSLGGYRWGPPVKQFLLTHEGRLPPVASAEALF
jgi:methylated-DNA-[protein]-cysteine S-methyltransferase